MSYVPNVLVENGDGTKSRIDVFSSLFSDRVIFLGSEINDQVANTVIAQMLKLSAQDDSDAISLYINSPGGSVTSALAIYDTMQFIPNQVNTWCLGLAASAGALLLAAGAQGHRLALPHAEIMIHQPHLGGGGIGGQVTDIEIQARQLGETKNRLNRILARHTSQPLETIEAGTERDNWLHAQEAVEFGLIDEVRYPGDIVFSPDTGPIPPLPKL